MTEWRTINFIPKKREIICNFFTILFMVMVPNFAAETIWFVAILFSNLASRMVLLEDGSSEHVAYIWCKIDNFQFFLIWRLFRCNQIPSKNRNAWFTPDVRTVKWATMWYKNHGQPIGHFRVQSLQQDTFYPFSSLFPLFLCEAPLYTCLSFIKLNFFLLF